MSKHTIAQYQIEVARCRGEGDDRAWALGLTGESGEVAELIKKLHYHGGADKKGPITGNRILDECGDVLWYLTALLNCYGYSLHDCIDANIAKLQRRFPNGFNYDDAHKQTDYKVSS